MLLKFVSRQFEWRNLRFRCEIWALPLKKLKLGIGPPNEVGLLRKLLKHQIEVDNNPC